MVKYLIYEYKGKKWPPVCWDDANAILKGGDTVPVDGSRLSNNKN
jgi:hypothetical protein